MKPNHAGGNGKPQTWLLLLLFVLIASLTLPNLIAHRRAAGPQAPAAAKSPTGGTPAAASEALPNASGDPQNPQVQDAGSTGAAEAGGRGGTANGPQQPADPSGSQASSPSGGTAGAVKDDTQPAPASDKAEALKPAPPVSLSNRLVEYHIHVSLNAGAHTLSGQETLTWKNPGSKPVQEMYLHLYPNAFDNPETTFMAESGGQLRGDRMKEGGNGNMQLQDITTVDGADLLKNLKYVHPDDSNSQDHTLAWVPLPQPVDPGQSVTLKIGFNVTLPQVFARMGYLGNFVMAGQWYPKVAVYEPAGTRNREAEGWNIHEYHGNSEFYSDFGIYSVQIRVPKNFIVAATGSPTKNAVVKGETKTYQFYADDVHDFAWSASPDFLYSEQPFSSLHVPGVKIKLYLDPSQKGQEQRYFAAAKKALIDYSNWYGDYPYHTLSIVIPPKGGNGAGGMEYPTLVTGWSADQADKNLELERVIVHEIGHQYWYGMVASNEFEEAWLDEGFTSYAEDKVMEKEYGIKPNLPVEASYITSPQPLKWYAWKYQGQEGYADNVYIRAKLVLTDIESQIGQETMAKVMRTYFQRWKFRHPSTEDFQQVLEQVTHRSWQDYFDQFVYGGSMVDYAVESIQLNPTEENGKRIYENSVKIARQGGYDQAVPIVFHFADGSEIRKSWSGETATVEYKLPNASPLEWVALDPNYQLVLENKHINNFLRATVDPAKKIRWIIGVQRIIEAVINQFAW